MIAKALGLRFDADMAIPRPLRLALLACIFAMLVPCCLRAAGAAARPDTLKVYLVTFGPGEEIFEKFAHNAIWIHDPSSPEKYRDVAFNYGLFNFGGDFVYRFARGDMRYWMGGYGALEMIQLYQDDNRNIGSQELNLNPRQAQQLSDFLWDNAAVANRYYAYNYYTDNCSTRVRDALDRVLQGQIKRQTQDVITTHSYRFHTLRIISSNPVLYVCLQMLLGEPADRPISRWDEMFLPIAMQNHLRDVKVMDEAGNWVPLVGSERTIFCGTRLPVAALPPPWGKYFTLAGILTALALFLLHAASQRSRWARRAMLLLAMAWSFLIGFGGSFLALATLLTTHWPIYYNQNLLQFFPPAILTVFVLPKAFRGQPRALRRAMRLSLLTLASSLIGVVLKIMPVGSQDNWSIIFWVLPVHMVLAIILIRESRRIELAANITASKENP